MKQEHTASFFREQNRTPLVDALKQYRADRPVYFCIPGHRYERGVSSRWLAEGERDFLKYDLTEAEGLDDLHHPSGVIRDSQELMARLYGVRKSYFLVNGTTCGNEAMLLAALKEGDEVLIPRNVHKSVWYGLVLSGAKPVYVMPEEMGELEITGGLTPQTVESALRAHPGCRAVFLVNPTYYGICSDVEAIAAVCHRYRIPLLVDEAHGAHIYFHSSLPKGAMEQGADLAAQSFHKTTGSLTQASVLHVNSELIAPAQVERALKLVQSTSPSYLLMASLDASRYELAREGETMMERALKLARDGRMQINGIHHMHCLTKEEAADGRRAVDLDETRLLFCCDHMTGYELQKVLRSKFGIETEMADRRYVLAIVTFANEQEEIERLVEALKQIGSMCPKVRTEALNIALPEPGEIRLSPREAYFADTKTVFFDQAKGEIAGEMIAPYPPGIPIVCPGEELTAKVMETLKICQDCGCRLHGPKDESLERINVVILPKNERKVIKYPGCVV